MLKPTHFTGKKPTITVYTDETNEDHLKKFHCVVCGKVTFEYYSNVRMIVPGQPKHVSGAKVIQCNGAQVLWDNGQRINTKCRTKYTVL